MLYQSIYKRGRLSALIALFLLAVGLSVMPRAQAATCYGTSCNGKNPATTGCTYNSYLARQWPVVYASNGQAVSGVYMQLYYSRSCGTNWVRVNANPFGGYADKRICNAWTGYCPNVERDWGNVASFSMMVYAPGSTPVQLNVQLRDTSGAVRGYAEALQS